MISKLKVLLEKSKRILGLAFIVHLVGGFLVVVALALAPEIAIGEGRFDQFVRALESLDFKWWLVGFSLFVWLLPIAVVVTWRRTKAAGIEIDRLREKVLSLLEGRSIPVTVDIDERIPVTFDTVLRVPVGLETEIDIDSEVEIEAEVPIRTELPIDTTVKTSVFGLGNISIPIQAKLPLDFVVPIGGRLRLRASAIPISLEEEARIQLPPIEVPLRCRLETRIDVRSNLEASGLLDG